MRRFMIGFLTLAMILGLSACGQKEESVQVIAMDTAMTFTAYGKEAEAAITGAGQEVRRLDKLLSRTSGDSDICRLNDRGTAEVDAEVWDLIEEAGTYTRATGGCFDITTAPLSNAWGFTTDTYHVPSREELDSLLPLVGPEHVHSAGSAAEGKVTVSLDEGSRIDLGAIGKGYASDRVAEVFREHGVELGWAALGGNVLAVGTRPDGDPWLVGIKDPAQPDDPSACLGMLQLQDAYAVTSGNYERYFEENGKRYHHIIDPATGYPAESGLVSVTVVADSLTETGELTQNGTMCDALSTALFVMGEERAVEFWRSGTYDFQMVLVTENGRVVVTEGLEDCFALEVDGYVCETVS